MTLIEMMIYAALLSILLTGFIYCAYDSYFSDIDIIHEIEDAYAK